MAVVLGQYHTTPPTLINQSQEPLQMDTRGNLKVTIVDLNGTAAADPGGASATVTGSTPYANAALKATKAVVKAGATSIYGWHIFNLDNTVTYLQMFNKLTAGVTVGSTTPDVVLVVPASGWLDDPGFTPPLGFGTGFVIAATTTYGGSSAQTNGLVVNFFYA